MNLKNIVSNSLLLALCLGATSCDDKGTPPATASSFLVSSMTLPTNANVSAKTVAGFNLDNIVSTGPDTNDCLNRVDREGPNGTGIDNQLGPAIGELANGALQDAINQAKFGLTMEVTGSGASRSLTLRTLPTSFTTIVLEGGKPKAGQNIPRGNVVATVPATVSAGNVLEVTLPSLPLTIPLSGAASLNLNLSQVRLQATLTANGIARAAIGGVLTRDELVSALTAAGYQQFIGVIDDLADFVPVAGMPGKCTSISVGLAFTAVNAVLVEGGGTVTDAGADAN